MFKHLPDCPQEPHEHIFVVSADKEIVAVFARTIADPLLVQCSVKSEPEILATNTLRIALFLAMGVGALLNDTGLSEIADEVAQRILDLMQLEME